MPGSHRTPHRGRSSHEQRSTPHKDLSGTERSVWLTTRRLFGYRRGTAGGQRHTPLALDAWLEARAVAPVVAYAWPEAKRAVGPIPYHSFEHTVLSHLHEYSKDPRHLRRHDPAAIGRGAARGRQAEYAAAIDREAMGAADQIVDNIRRLVVEKEESGAAVDKDPGWRHVVLEEAGGAKAERQPGHRSGSLHARSEGLRLNCLQRRGLRQGGVRRR